MLDSVIRGGIPDGLDIRAWCGDQHDKDIGISGTLDVDEVEFGYQSLVVDDGGKDCEVGGVGGHH